MGILNGLISLIFYLITFIGGLVYIFAYELLSLLINLYQAIIQGLQFPEISKYLDLQLPNFAWRFVLGVLGIIMGYLGQRFFVRYRIKRYRRQRFAFARKERQHHLNLNGDIFDRHDRKKYDKLLNERLISHKIALDPTEFERFIAYFVFRSGFSPVLVTPQCHDYGIDVISTFRKKTYGFQAKFYKHTHAVDISAVQEAVAGAKAYGLDTAVVVTTSDFTESAYQLAQATGTILINRGNFEYWQKHPEFIFTALSVTRYPKWLLNAGNRVKKASSWVAKRTTGHESQKSKDTGK